MRSPYKISIYDRHYVKQGTLGDALAVEPVLRCNDMGTATLTLGLSNSKLPDLIEPGSRVVIEQDGDYRIGGPIRGRGGKWSGANGEITLTVEDHFRVFRLVQGWPVPGAALSAQTSEYHTVSGPAETVLKTVVQSNAVNRLGWPITIEPDEGRGANITVSLRFTPILDKLFPVIEAAGLKVTVRHDGAGLRLSVSELVTLPRTIKESSGTIESVTWNNQPPELTDVIVGGQGEGVERTFRGFTDPALAELWGERSEGFRDARDTDNPLVYEERAAETFAETGEKSGLAIKFMESKSFAYGGLDGFVEGNRLKLQIGPKLQIEDIVRSVAMPWTRNDGLVVSPQIGDITDDPDEEIGRALRTLAAGQRTERTR
ncbi:hypothetical protein [Arthrobacter sp. B1805]|uniref:Gp37-like protein n=1 Tax=Arthrobacter sp. B1805 TaxID=2058892 RepID=UPI0015E3A0B6|nr:hypothetical protein [Arthrobacter sp. B1805]